MQQLIFHKQFFDFYIEKNLETFMTEVPIK